MKEIKIEEDFLSVVFNEYFGDTIFADNKTFDNENLKKGAILEGLAETWTNTDFKRYLTKEIFKRFRLAALCDDKLRERHVGALYMLDEILRNMKEAYEFKNKKKFHDGIKQF